MRAIAQMGPCEGVHDRSVALTSQPESTNMLYTIAVILVILWLLGMVTATTMGGFVHVLLVIAVIVVLFQVISGRKRVKI